MDKTPPLILVDGSSYLFRAYHALPPLTNSSGEATGATVGVINMLRKLIADYRPTHMAVVFDAPGKTFRDALYPEYKANRPPMPDDLREQIEPTLNIIRAMGLPLLIVDDVEADDVIGTLARQAAAHGIETLVSTSDKDMAQLVDQHVTLVNTMSDTRLDAQGVFDKFGVRPDQIIDFLALTGDSVDNIPGVAKCGPKTAAKWLAQYGTLDEVMAHANEVKGKVGEHLRAALPTLPLSRTLTTIKTDVPLDVVPDDLRPADIDRTALRTLYQRLESRRLLASLDEDEDEAATGRAAAAADAVDYQTVLDLTTFDGWLQQLQHAELFSFDTETTSLDYMQARIVGVSFAIEPRRAAYVPLAHAYPGAPAQLDRDTVLAALKPLLEDPGRHKVGQNLKYDMSVLANHGIELRGVAFDTMLESYVLNAGGGRHDMDHACRTLPRSQDHPFRGHRGQGRAPADLRPGAAGPGRSVCG